MWLHKSILYLVAAKSRNCRHTVQIQYSPSQRTSKSYAPWRRFWKTEQRVGRSVGGSEIAQFMLATWCAMMHVVIFWPREYKTRYRTSTGESIRSMRDDACCDFLAKRIQNPISHIDWRIESVDVRWWMLWFFWPREYKTRYRTSTGESSRSMRDDACCDFMAKRIQNPISHIDWRIESVASRSMRDDACCDFLANRIQQRTSHIVMWIESVDVREWWLTLLEICPKWRLSKKRGLVADGWMKWTIRVDFGTLPCPNLCSYSIVIDWSYLRFHTFFTLGPNAQLLFATPQWSTIRADACDKVSYEAKNRK